MAQMQYYTPNPTAAHIAPTLPSNPPALPPNPTSANPIMSFAPANVLPMAPTTRCAPGACKICDAQFLCVLHQAHTLNSVQTAPLPHRRTCRPTFHPDHPGIDIETHSLEAGKYFYVAVPARDEGIYTSFAVARQKSEGVVNGLHVAAPTFAEAKGLWALACLHWHGNECKRERLQRVDAQRKHWALKGSDVICRSRAAVFRLTEDADLDKIHICGHHDVSVLDEWLGDY